MKFKRILKENLILFIILIFLPFRLYGITSPLVDATNFRQAQTATIALNFYKNGINLLKTELDIFGIGKERFLTLEFPLYEAIITTLYKIFFMSDMWGRVVSVIFGYIGGWYVYKIVHLILKKRSIAILSFFFFLVAPLNMLYHRDFMIETTVIAFHLAGLYHFCVWVKRNDTKHYLVSVIFLALGFMQKGVYGPFLIIPMTVYYIGVRSFRNIFSMKFIAAIVIPLGLLLLWQQHVNNINTANGHEYFTSYNKAHLEWNFGTLADRFSTSLWQFRLNYLLSGVFLKPGLFLFVIGLSILLRIDKSRFLSAWLLSQIIYFLTYFRIQSHNYYQMFIIPITSITMAIGLDHLSNGLSKIGRTKQRIGKYIYAIFTAIFCAFFLWRSWLHTRWDYVVDWNWYKRIVAVGNAVPGGSYGIFVTPGYDWNSVYTYYTKKKMMVVGAENVTEENIKNWKDLGYSFIVLHDYHKYPDYLAEMEKGHTLDFLDESKNILTLNDFKVYLL